ncbi:MAG: excinuclease ABC subunit UvrA, partial [Rhodobacteraceae bacterium]|nr:excinuclease ABC subunit UvrA [Paracoccaceae bacterium]
LVLYTGISGSGKSSLAMGTVYAEGQRRYVESLSVYARQFLGQIEKPDVDLITGLSPAIAIEQKTTSRNPRSTVGTITEIHDYLRLLFARAGVPHSPATGLPIVAQQISDMIDRINQQKPGSRAHLQAPIVRERKGTFQQELKDYMRLGFVRCVIDGKTVMLDKLPRLAKNKRHDIDLLVDRIVIGEAAEERLEDSLRTSLEHGNGTADLVLIDEDPPRTIRFSERYACPVSGFTIAEIEPRLFSFNAHMGSCPGCDGLGTEYFYDGHKMVDHECSMRHNPILPLREGLLNQWDFLTDLMNIYRIDPDHPWKHLPEDFKQAVFRGTGERAIDIYIGSQYKVHQPYIGLVGELESRYPLSGSSRNWRLDKYITLRTCSTCGGHRLKPEALAVKLAGLHIGELAELTIQDARDWIDQLPATLSSKQMMIADPILRELRERLGFLVNVGLDYLTLARSAGTLSGGESQRIRLASQIGKGLTGVLYVLDEPSIGLHQRDNRRLIETLCELRNRGNTVLVVEHDEEAIREADHVIDFGPGAGIHGGQIVATGTPEEIAANPASLTGLYLSGNRSIAVPRTRRRGTGRSLKIMGAAVNNLKTIDVRIPLGRLVCITGVSGSGKSSLAFDVLNRNIHNACQGDWQYENCMQMLGMEHISRTIHINQQPIGRTPRSNPATYTKAFDHIRNLFAELPEARTRGYKPGIFSFNVKGGRCEECQGDGLIRVQMHFLPDVFVTCEKCHGRRFTRQTLQVKYQGHSIADVLDMTILEAFELFSAIPAIHSKLDTLVRAGLGYMKVGHPAPMLSGGEAQRVKLAKELSRRGDGRTLYLLVGRTTGLQLGDIRS